MKNEKQGVHINRQRIFAIGLAFSLWHTMRIYAFSEMSWMALVEFLVGIFAYGIIIFALGYFFEKIYNYLFSNVNTTWLRLTLSWGFYLIILIILSALFKNLII